MDAETLARIDAFVTSKAVADVTIRSGSLNPEADPPQTRRWEGELDTDVEQFVFGGVTLSAALDDLDAMILAAHPIFGE